LKFKIKNSRSI